MRILVTGGTGFVGLNVVEELLRREHEVAVLDRLPLVLDAERAFGERSGKLKVAVGDVTDAAFVLDTTKTFEAQAIVHAAAITADAAREARSPNEIADVNVGGTINVLQAAKATGCRRLLYVGSGQAYGETHAEGRILQEELSPSRPEDLYGITKFVAEQIALRLGTLWALDVVAVRLGSVCGPWEFDTGVRDLLSPYFQVAKMAIRGGAAILPERETWRDWIYSRDVAAGIARIVENPEPRHRLYHLSSGIDWRGSLGGWCDALADAYPRFSWRIAVPGEVPNVSHRVARDRAPMDISRIVADVGFRPRFGPNDAYPDYLAWIRAHEGFITGETRVSRHS